MLCDKKAAYATVAVTKTVMFNKKTILITGAAGFIGGRILERLCLETNAKVIALVHDVNHLPRIAKYDITIVTGDILDRRLLQRITRGVDYIIHCAVGNTSDSAYNYTVAVRGTKNILDAARINNIKQLIYFSTVYVYGYPLPATVDENAPYQYLEKDAYNNFKIDAEKMVRRYSKNGVPITILQPTIVYGPYGYGWTTHIVEKMKRRAFLLINDGNGIANPVYVDNVVDAVFLALTTPAAIGERFIISDGKPVTWRQFYNYFYSYVTGDDIPATQRIYDTLAVVLSLVVRPIRALKNKIFPYPLFPSERHPIRYAVDTIVQKGISFDATSQQSQDTFTSTSVFSIKKARAILHYTPRISLAKGMELTRLWLIDRGL
jgi:nucleoside-diphosphate-sugar epimerase